MCMKNVSTDVILFSSVDAPLESQSNIFSVHGVDRGVPTVPVVYRSGDILGIETLSFLLCINAVERRDEPVHDEGDAPENTFFFTHKYEVCLRLTEPTSGKFVDLDTYEIEPEVDQIILCRKIYDKKMLCQYHNISVAEPPKGKDLCVLKVLIRLCGSNSNWFVQSMHPIQIKLPDQGES